jgi:DNA primase
MSSPEIDEIKSRLNVAEVVGEYIRLAKAGSNWKALCPFHNEKSPSFMVSEERGSWHCFGCGKGGDVFSFVMEMEGIGFREALEQLAAKAGVELKSRGMGHESGSGEKDQKNDLYKILELATKWYEKNLWEGKDKEKILKYLRGRGLSDESIKKFRLGYAPDGWRNMLDFLTKRGYSVEEISKTGLLVEKNSENQIQNSGCYDRFRDRIMFPIQDILGRVVGYSARVAPGGDEKSAKYVNTPQTALYDKGKILYGLNFAKVEIKKRNEAILVEGNMDVIASHQAGFSNTVAVSGTALTSEQVKILSRYGENIKMGFDMDAAGQAAARRSIRTCLENDINVKIILLSSGKDAADSLQDDPEIWRRAVESAEGVMEYYFKEAFSRFDSKVPTEKKKIARELLNVIKDISNPIEQSHWLKELSGRIGTEEKVLIDVLRKTKTRDGAQPPRENGEKKTIQTTSLGQKIIGIILAFPGDCRKELSRISSEDFQNEKERAIIETIKQDAQNFSLDKLKAFFSDYEMGKFLEGAVFEAELKFGSSAESGFGDKDKLDPVAELKGYVSRLKKDRRKENISRVVQKIKDAEASGDKISAKKIMEEFQGLMEDMPSD